MPPRKEPGAEPGGRKDRQMTTGSTGNADAVNDRLLQLLEQVVANQAIQASANLNEEIAQRLTAALQYRDTPAQPGFSDSQRQLVLRFRALRNGLGNLARHGDQDTVLLPAPQLYDGALTFKTALPQDAGTLRLFASDGTQTYQVALVGGEREVTVGVDDVAWVQVDDQRGNPILLGFPQLVLPDGLS
jgi:hypothetical protein